MEWHSKCIGQITVTQKYVLQKFFFLEMKAVELIFLFSPPQKRVVSCGKIQTYKTIKTQWILSVSCRIGASHTGDSILSAIKTTLKSFILDGYAVLFSFKFQLC